MKASYRLIVFLFLCVTSILHAQFNQTNLKLWLKADAMASSLNDGDNISQWTDYSGNDNHALQSTTSNQPVLRLNAVGNYPAVLFNGTSSYLNLPSNETIGIKNQEYEIFIVSQYSVPYPMSMLSAHSNNGNSYDVSVINDASGGGNSWFQFSPLPGYIITMQPGVNFANNQPHIFSVRASSSQAVLRVDAYHELIYGSNYLNNENCSSMLVGCNGYSSNYFNGYIAEVLIFNSILSEIDRNEVEDYLTEKYDGDGYHYYVNNTSDENTGAGYTGTLRYALNKINTHASTLESTIDMTDISNTILLTSELPPINYKTTIQGPGESNLTISGNNLYRPFFIGSGTAPFSPESPAAPVVSISNLTIAHGRGKGGDGGTNAGGGGGMGGALFVNAGNVNLDHVTFSDNHAIGGNVTYTSGAVGGGGGFSGNGETHGIGAAAGGSSGYLGGNSGSEGTNTDGGSGGVGAGGGGAVGSSTNSIKGGAGGFASGGGSAATSSSNALLGGSGGFGGGGGIPNGSGGFGGGHANSTDAGSGSGMGGAIFNRGGTLTVQNSTFIRNIAQAGTGGNTGLTYGGAIFNYTGTCNLTNITYGTGTDINSAHFENNIYSYTSPSTAQFNSTSLKLWLKAGTLSSSVSEGQNVSVWTDVSGKGRDAVQPYSTSYQPVYSSTGMNGKTALQFSGSENYFVLPSPAALGIKNQEYEIFIVAQSASTANQFLLSANTDNYELQLNESSAGLRFNPVTSQTSDIGTSGLYSDNLTHIFSCRASSTSGIVRVDNTDGAASSSNSINNNNYSFILLGGRATATGWFNGFIAEVLVFSSVLSTIERKAVEQYLWNEYKKYYIVNSIYDENTGSENQGTLRYVMNAINTLAPANGAVIDMTGLTGTITLGSNLPPINYNTMILGSGENNLTISGNDLYRPFFIGAGTSPFTPENPAAPIVSISNLTISHGKGKGGDGFGHGGGGGGMGGAIFINKGKVAIENVIFSYNSAVGGTSFSGSSSSGGGGGGFGGDATGSSGANGGYLGGLGGAAQGEYANGGNGGIGGGGGGTEFGVGGNGGFGGGGGAPRTTLGTPGNGGFGGGGASGGYAYGYGGFGAGRGDHSWFIGGGGGAFGGAIFNYTGTLSLINSVFISNSAVGGTGSHDGSGYGGAVFNYGGSFALLNVTYGSGADANSADYQVNFYLYGGTQSLAEVLLLPSTGISETAATLNASINPNGYATNYHFAYGTDPNSFSTVTAEQSAGSGTLPVNVSLPLTGLTAGVTYYFQVTASNVLGTVESPVSCFFCDTSIPHTNLKLWLNADNGVLTHSGINVSTWCDLSNNNNSATQSTESYRPGLTSSAINGHNALSFTGTDDFLTLTKPSELGIVNSNYELFAVIQSSSSNTQYIISGSSNNYQMYINGSGGASYAPNSSDVISKGTTGQFADASPHFISSRINAAGTVIRIDGIDCSSPSGQNGQNSDDTALRIGLSSSGAGPFNGYIAEILIYNTNLDESTRNSIETYLANKYSITGGKFGGPSVEITTASNVTSTSATLNGTVKPNGNETTYFFRYGTSSSALTQTTPVQSAGSGNSSVAVSANITGLTSGTKYYYQLSSEDGTKTSAIKSFFHWTSIPASNLKVWLDAGKGTNSSEPGSSFWKWDDQSVNGNNATQLYSSQAPVFQHNVIDGNPVVRFSNSKHLHLPAISTISIETSDYEIFVVAKTTNTGRQLIISGAPGWGPEIQLNGWGYGASLISNNKDECNYSTAGTYSNGTAHVFSIRATSTYGTLRIDGEDNVTSNLDYRAPNSSEFHIGIRGTTEFGFDGDIAEIIIYNTILSSQDRSAVEVYLAKKYSLTSGSLGGPSVQLSQVSNLLSTSATLNATVNPNGFETTCFFRYGTSSTNMNLTTTVQNKGSGTSAVAVSADITGLTPGTKYYYQISATSGFGTKNSSYRSFIYSSIPTTNLRLWLDAGSGTSTTTSGSAISQWNDRSVNGFNATQSTGSSQPTYQAAVIDGLPAIRFTSFQYLDLHTASEIGINGSDYEIFFVARSSSSATQFLMGGTVPEYELILNTSSAGVCYIADGITGSGSNKELNVGSRIAYTDNNAHVFNVSIGSTGSKFIVDGIVGAQTLSDFRNSNTGAIVLGKRSDNSLPFYGDIMEVIIYNTTLDAATRSNIESYLASKYNITSGALPVELTTFSAKQVQSNIELKWTTATEVNNYGFEIERLQDYKIASVQDWEKIGFVEGAGNSNSPKEYSFTDQSVGTRLNVQPTTCCVFLYRLKQIDTDGKFTYSNETEVNVKYVPKEFSLMQNYPNPFNPSTVIKYSLPSESNIKLKIYNSIGEEISTLVDEIKSAGFFESIWNAESVSSGIYFYSIEAKSLNGKNNFRAVKKMLLIK